MCTKSKEPESQTKYSLKNKMRTKKKEKDWIYTHHKQKRNQILGIVQSQKNLKVKPNIA